MSGKLIRLVLRNFQPHDEFTLEFSPTVTVVVGRNSVGKSALFRAIRWIAFNRPLGDRVIRWGSKECFAMLVTDEHDVVRFRGIENTYRLDGGEPFRAVGSDVPKEVTQALRLDPINFQRQIDGPFWLTLSPPEIAREMNRVVDLSVVDTSMSNAAAKMREATSQVKALTGLLHEAKLRVGRLHWVRDVEADAREALRCEQEAARKRSEAEAISRVVSRIEEAQASSCAIPDPSPAAPLIKRLREIDLEIRSLNKLISQIEDEEADLCAIRREIATARKEAEAARPELCDRCGQPLLAR